MGKGARNREKYTEERKAKKEQAIIDEKKSKTKKKVISIVSVVMAAVILISSSVYFFFYANGKYLRDTIVVSTENYRINNAMMTYLFKSSYLSMQSQYGEEYFALITGIDTEKSLKKQYADAEGTTTWFDSILDNTKTYLTEILMLAEAAHDEGLELSESEIAKIDADLKDVDPYFVQDGVQTGDIRDALMIVTLAQKYENIFMNGLEISENDVNNHYKENMNAYRTAAYRVYTLKYTDEVEEDVVSYTQEQANEKAEALENAKSEDDFTDIIKEITEELYPDMEEDEVQAKVESSLIPTGTYTEGNELSEWAFDDDTKVGDTKVLEDEENSAIVVVYLTQEAERNENETKNIRQILISTSFYDSTDAVNAKAEEVFAEYNADPVLEKFEELVVRNSNDAYTISTGGLYSAVQEGQLFPELDEWLFDDAREVGDVISISSDYGQHIAYFDGDGNEVWYEAVLKDLKDQAYSDQLTEWSSAYPIISSSEALNDLPV